MNFLKALCKKTQQIRKGAFFNSSHYELENLLCGIGTSEILKSEIRIIDYPFKPSKVYPNRLIQASEIDAISFDSYPPLLKIQNEVVFISRENSNSLKLFMKRNGINSFEPSRTWSWILEPYLDTEYTVENHKRIIKLLSTKKIHEVELSKIRSEIKNQMFKYNFDTMLWEWGGLDLSDVLAAMRVKYNDEDFRDFYKRAMEIQLR
ncbi:hypothetical protein [Owenweeksia hongkongensis]|uniref:hypothetical protein n=1 Tax=Owenweeksia hongkongensis TaxID=253245 RepID=UPI003A940B1B